MLLIKIMIIVVIGETRFENNQIFKTIKINIFKLDQKNL